MNYLINQLMTVDKAFYRHYLEMLLTLNRIHALTPWQMSMLLWRAKIFHIQVLYPELLRISLCTEQEKVSWRGHPDRRLPDADEFPCQR